MILLIIMMVILAIMAITDLIMLYELLNAEKKKCDTKKKKHWKNVEALENSKKHDTRE